MRDFYRKQRSKPVWSGPGEYYRPGIAERNAFLDAIGRRVPEVLSDLKLECLPCFVQLRELVSDSELRRLRREWPPTVTLLSEFAHPARRSAAALRHALRLWTKRYRIDRPWVMQAALRSLNLHEAETTGFPRLRCTLMPGIHGLLSFHFHGSPWNPSAESSNEYRRRLESQVTKSLKVHFDSVRLEPAQEGLKPVVRGTPKDYFDYLALWQCRGWTAERIAEECEKEHYDALDESTVRKGINTAAARLDMVDILRPGARGRRRRKPE